MLQVEYNDHLTNLTLINKLSDESLIIVDDTLKVYGKLSYNPFEPTKADLLHLWGEALKDYLNMGSSNPLMREWRENTYHRSLEQFKQADIFKETED